MGISKQSKNKKLTVFEIIIQSKIGNYDKVYLYLKF